MRIGMFTDIYYPYLSGVVISVDSLRRTLEKEGHEVYIITSNLENQKFLYDKKNRIIRIPGIGTPIPGTKLVYPYSIRTARIMKKWKLDVIHSHTEFGVGTFARIVGKQLNIPIVHTYHTMYEDCVYFVTKGYFDNVSKKIVEYLTKFYCDKTVSELIVPTDKAKEKFIKQYKVDRNIHIVPNIIEIDKYYKENVLPDVLEGYKKQFGIKETDFCIMYLGRVSEEKNIMFLMNAMPKLVKYNKNIKLVICGSGNALDGLKNAAKKKKINNNVIFTDLYPFEESPYYYQLGQVFVMASKSETQGMTVIEALSSSKPVICIEDDSYRNTVIHGYNGYFFKNEKEYIEYVKELMDNPDKLEEFSNNAHESIQKYSPQVFANNILNVYKIAIEKNKMTFMSKLKKYWGGVFSGKK
ncbi:MAG: glycosyltransferase [Bacilli bacterium]|nr:glycosyltransferase [Bacilli bacterium]MDD4608103.1 glycosyltransferase [Bacilli bacterium]